MDTPTFLINTKLLPLRSLLYAFENNLKPMRAINEKDTMECWAKCKSIVKVWCPAWFNRIKGVMESAFNTTFPSLQASLKGMPDYFKEILTIETALHFLDNFYENIVPFVTDELNIYRAACTEIVKDSYSIELELTRAEYEINTQVIFNYEILCAEEVDVKTTAKIIVRAMKNI
jgi:hypothetical protein